MAETNFRDAYILVQLFDAELTPSINDEVLFLDNSALIKGNCIGSITSYVEDVLAVGESLDKFRSDGLVPKSVDEYAFANSHDRCGLGIEKGVVVATFFDLVVVYCGVVDLGDDFGTENAINAYDRLTAEDERYEITEKGLKYLADLASNIVDEVCKEAEACQCAPEEREENSTMDNLFGNLGFGKLRSDRFKLSMNGIAVAQDSGKYVVYNKDNNEFVDATNTLFDIKDALFLLPAVEVNVGDTILHEDKAYFIVDTTNEIKAVSYADCTQTVLIPKSTMFGIKYFTKVFSMFGDNFAATGDLFSNPMMLMALMEGKNSDLTQLMLMSSLSNGDLGSNPMALAMMLKGDKGDDSLSTIALMSMFSNGTNPFAPKKKVTNKAANEK